MSERLTPEYEQAIKDRLALAIAGPWTVSKKIKAAVVVNDALLAVSAILHDDVPALFKELSALREEREDVVVRLGNALEEISRMKQFGAHA